MELQVIQSKIYEVRGLRVMVDRDLAELYQVETRRLNEVVKRNLKRFPSDFMFQLSSDEFGNLISQNATSSWGGTRKLPYVFTEQGLAMLSGLLNSDVAISVNISIMRAFVAMRQYLTSSATVSAALAEIRAKLQLLERGGEETLGAVNDLSEDVYKEIGTIYEAITALSLKPAPAPRRPMGYRFEPKDE